MYMCVPVRALVYTCFLHRRTHGSHFGYIYACHRPSDTKGPPSQNFTIETGRADKNSNGCHQILFSMLGQLWLGGFNHVVPWFDSKRSHVGTSVDCRWWLLRVTISKWPHSRLESHDSSPHIWVDPQLENGNCLFLSMRLSANLIFEGKKLDATRYHNGQTSSESFFDSLFTLTDHLAWKRMKPLSAMYRFESSLTHCVSLNAGWQKLWHWEGLWRCWISTS